MAEFNQQGALALVRRMLPIDTGNLRWNATYMINKGAGNFDIIIDEAVAPYVHDLEEGPYNGLFTQRIPAALIQYAGSDLQDRRDTATSSINSIADTAQSSPERVNTFLSASGAESKNGSQLHLKDL